MHFSWIHISSNSLLKNNFESSLVFKEKMACQVTNYERTLIEIIHLLVTSTLIYITLQKFRQGCNIHVFVEKDFVQQRSNDENMSSVLQFEILLAINLHHCTVCLFRWRQRRLFLGTFI